MAFQPNILSSRPFKSFSDRLLKTRQDTPQTASSIAPTVAASQDAAAALPENSNQSPLRRFKETSVPLAGSPEHRRRQDAIAAAPSAPTFHPISPFTAPVDIENLLLWVVAVGASDLVIESFRDLTIQTDNRTTKLPFQPTEQDIQYFLTHLVPANQKGALSNGESVDFAYSFERAGTTYRFRSGAVAITTEGASGWSIFLRHIPNRPPQLSAMGLPIVLQKALLEKKGLNIISGFTNDGKSTLLASILQEILAQNDPLRITAIESPVEFVQPPSNNSVLTSVDLSLHPDFSAGITAAVKTDPHILMVSEVRSDETLRELLTASEKCQAVYAVMFAGGVCNMIWRTISCTPLPERRTRLETLLDALHVVVTKHFVPGKKRKKVAIFDWLIFTPSIKKEILDCCQDKLDNSVCQKIESIIKLHGRTLYQDVMEKHRQGLLFDTTTKNWQEGSSVHRPDVELE